MKEKLKQTKGITLIALIITIIILLILAMVSIKLVINSGIISKSEQAVKIYSEEETKEKIQLAYTDYQMGKLSNENYTFEQALQNAGVAYKSVTGNDEEGYVVTVETKEGDKQYTVSSTGVGVAKTLEDYGLKIGDYVNYDEGTGYTYTTDTTKGVGGSVGTQDSTTKKYPLNSKTYTTENLGWRVLGVNAKGELELISDNPMSDANKLYLANEEGYLYGPDELNRMCNELYGKGEKATGARSLNVEDINKSLIEDFSFSTDHTADYGDIYSYRFPTSGDYMQYKRTKADGTLVTDWTNITYSSCQTFRMPGETNTISTSNRSDNGISVKVTYYVYDISRNLTNSTLSEMITKGTGKSNITQLLASRYNYCSDGVSEFGVYLVLWGNVNSDDGAIYSLYSSNFGGNRQGYSVRPVVSLSSDIQIEKTDVNDGSTLANACIIK